MLKSNWCDQIEQKAKNTLENSIYDFIAGAADDESTATNNIQAFKQYALRPRSLVNIADISTKTEILGVKHAFPLLIAPTSPHHVIHAEREIGMVNAASNTKTAMVVSFMASTRLEKISAHAKCDLWFQLQLLKDKALMYSLIKRAEKAGYKALVITVDMPIVGRRLRDINNQFKFSTDFMENVVLAEDHTITSATRLRRQPTINDLFDDEANWDAIDSLKQFTQLPILLKGILHPQDAKTALDIGVDGIIVSNHGGRQLGSTIATLDALAGITSITNNCIPILLDGGIRSGADIIKALALGASAVLIGRPILWGLAVGGAVAASGVIHQFQRELVCTMKLCGTPSINSIKESNILFKTT